MRACQDSPLGVSHEASREIITRPAQSSDWSALLITVWQGTTQTLQVAKADCRVRESVPRLVGSEASRHRRR